MNTLDERIILLRSRIAGANDSVASAEHEMEQAISQLAPVVSGDKRMGSEALGRAFLKLKEARHLIADLETMLAAALAIPRS
jgi:hypothetical protein